MGTPKIKRTPKIKIIASDDVLRSCGFDQLQIAALNVAEAMFLTGKVKNIDDLQDRIGHDMIDEAVLRDTFFSNGKSHLSLRVRDDDE